MVKFCKIDGIISVCDDETIIRNKLKVILEIEDATLDAVGGHWYEENGEIILGKKQDKAYDAFLKIVELKKWFDTEYTQKEQKYIRLIALGKFTDDNKDPAQVLKELYLLAEENRKLIQELEIIAG